ncbi:MAG TPA: amidase family protein [Stellaceae bacterium]|nr:amidase family protein [Stellaceae bacterium]
MDHLCDLSAVELRRRIGDKSISPVELLEDCVRRIEAVNPTLNAITAMALERARREAKAAEAAVLSGASLGLLHGLPIGIKDLHDTEGIVTTYGSPLYRGHVPAADDNLVTSVRRAGAIVVGKTNTPEFGAGANTDNPVYGPTGNPFDPKRSCGGSSGGSAVALATGMLPLATGSDTGGSLRIPAAFCGVVGFRPSPGVVPSERRPLGWTPISVLGPMGRSVADTRLLLRAEMSGDSADPFFAPRPDPEIDAPPRINLAKLRIAVSEDLGGAPVEQSIRATLRERVALFAHEFRACDWRDPDMAGADRAFAAIRAQNFLAGQRERYERHRDRLGPFVRANYEEGLAMSAADVALGHATQTRIYRSLERFFIDHDLLISPTVGVAPFPLDERYAHAVEGKALGTYYAWLAPTYYLSLTGHPCISIPCGLEPSGTPFALQLTGPARRDGFVLAAAEAIEGMLARDKRTARPVPDLRKLGGA